MRELIPILSRVLILVLATAGSVFAQDNPDWTEPFPPFRIAGNLYYVGSKGLANYLITTPQGNILINSDLESNVPMIQASIEKLGFKFKDTKILLISHAHWDHDAGSAKIKELTGASYMVMDADVPGFPTKSCATPRGISRRAGRKIPATVPRQLPARVVQVCEVRASTVQK